YDATGDASSGHWVVNGVAQGASQAINVSAGQLAQTTFQSGAGSDDLFVRDFDRTDCGAWREFHVNGQPNHAALPTSPGSAAGDTQSFAAPALLPASAADLPYTTLFRSYDATGDASSGHWVVNGVAQGVSQAINVSAGQLAQTTFQSGTGSDDL